MKKISAKIFFTVMWRGLCQALGWFFGLFGYNKNGKFAKCVWGLFATSAAVVMLIITSVLVCALGNEAYRWYNRKHYSCDNQYCYENVHVCRDIYFHNHEDGKGYIYNIRTGEKFVKHVAWIAKPMDKDSLVCFSNGKKRGYFNRYTGAVVIEPKYDHAWIFSEGLASVEDNGVIKFIDGKGKVVIDTHLSYRSGRDGYVFHGGYCIIDNDQGLYGLMDKSGKIVLHQEYDHITVNNTLDVWTVRKGNEMAAVDNSMKPILPMSVWTIYAWDGTLDVTMPDHTIRKYDYQGNLKNDFCISTFRTLEYDMDEISYRKMTSETEDEYGETKEVVEVEAYRPQGISKLRAYVAGDGYEGLMDENGRIITQPEYKNITAIGQDLYLCEVSNNDNVVLNGQGKIVR